MPDPLTEALIKRAYGQGNINLFTRPISKNDDGSISTLYSMGGADDAGNEWVYPGVDEHGKGIISPKDAWHQFESTHKYLGKFKTPEEGDAYGQKLHEDAQAGLYTVPLATSRKPADLGQLQKVLDFYLKGQR